MPASSSVGGGRGGRGGRRNIGMRKSASIEPIMKEGSSSEDDSPGGVRFSELSSSPSVENTPPKAASDGGKHYKSNSSTFGTGPNDEDDVFAGGNDQVPEDSHVVTQEYEDAYADDEEETALVPTEVPQVDAQNIWPPTACIFVANLAQAYDDASLEAEVTRVFNGFGRVFVKIRRDRFKMPFAFCQFTCDEDAIEAERSGKGLDILMRPCRTEMVKANVTFLVYKRDKEPTSLQEAFDLLNLLGRVAKVQHLSTTYQKQLRLPSAVIGWYAMYDSKRDPVRNFQNHSTYRVVEFDPQTMTIGATGQRVAPKAHNFLESYDKDRRSVFMGNLPLMWRDDDLKKIMRGCGPVVEVQMFNRHVPGGNGLRNSFAFVEFVRPDSVDDAIRNFNGHDFHGHRLKVQHKRTKGSTTTPNRSISTAQSPYSTSSFPQSRSASASDRASRFNYAPTPARRPALPAANVDSPTPKSYSAVVADGSIGSRSKNRSERAGSVSFKDDREVAKISPNAVTPPSKEDSKMTNSTPVSMPPPPHPPMMSNAFSWGYHQMQMQQMQQNFMPPMTPQGTPGMPYVGYGGYPGYMPPYFNPYAEMYGYGNMIPNFPSPMGPPPPPQRSASTEARELNQEHDETKKLGDEDQESSS